MRRMRYQADSRSQCVLSIARGGVMNIKLSAANIVSIIILMCILAAMVSIAIMQVVRTVEDIGPRIYIVGGAVAVVGAVIPIMLIILVRHLKKYNQD